MINLKSKKYKRLIICIVMFITLIFSESAYAATFQWPIDDFSTSNVTSPMYYRSLDNSKGFHAGWDISRDKNETIYAAADGEVTYSGWSDGCGYCVTLKHYLSNDLIINIDSDQWNFGKILYTRYMHLNAASPYVTGDKVKAGTPIGIMGNTGNSTGIHLHFDIMNFAGGMSKSSDDTYGLGVSIFSPWNNNANNVVYTVLINKASEKGDSGTHMKSAKAAISPELIIGQNLANELSGTIVKDLNTGEEVSSIGGYNKGTIRAGNTTSYISNTNGIVDKEDVLTQLQVSGEQIDYGKIVGLESQVTSVKEFVVDFSRIVSVILIFVGTVLSGVSIILNRNNPEGRMAGITALGAVGVGGLIIGSASLLVSLIANFAN